MIRLDCRGAEHQARYAGLLARMAVSRVTSGGGKFWHGGAIAPARGFIIAISGVNGRCWDTCGGEVAADYAAELFGIGRRRAAEQVRQAGAAALIGLQRHR